MANVTICEFFELPDESGNLNYPENVKTTIASTVTHTLRDETKFLEISADADCRISFNGDAAVSSDRLVNSAVPNPFKLDTRGGSNRTLKFR